MNRRKALSRIGISFGSISMSTGVISIIQSCNTEDSSDLKYFSLSQINFLDRILEIIIPETDSPGAKSLNLSKFIDVYIAKNIRTEDQIYLNAMMNEFMKMILDSENKSSIEKVDDITIENYFSDHIDNYNMIADNGKNYSQICDLFREMAVNSYKASEYVMTNKLGFVPIPGYYDGNVEI